MTYESFGSRDLARSLATCSRVGIAAPRGELRDLAIRLVGARVASELLVALGELAARADARELLQARLELRARRVEVTLVEERDALVEERAPRRLRLRILRARGRRTRGEGEHDERRREEREEKARRWFMSTGTESNVYHARPRQRSPRRWIVERP